MLLHLNELYREMYLLYRYFILTKCILIVDIKMILTVKEF